MPESPSFSEPVGHRTVTHAAITTFGGLTGDYAQMHFDRDFGTSQGMGGTIAHGLLSGAWALGALAQHAPERLGLGEPSAVMTGYRVKFSRMIFIDDLFSLRWRNSEAPATEGLASEHGLHTEFEVLNQRDEVVTRGSVSMSEPRADESSGDGPSLPLPSEPLSIGPWTGEGIPLPIYAEDMVKHGPRGESLGRTVTETDIVNWTNFTGELNPLYLNAPFAEEGAFGARVAPPMWTFCLGFGDYLRDLLSVSMPSSGFAGHLGDSWRFFAPVLVHDTLRTRHRPVSFKPSGSRPGMGVVEFALEIVNQRDEIVQDGRVAMMMSMR